jgi:integrase
LKQAHSPKRRHVATGVYLEAGAYVAGYTHPLTGSWTTAVLNGVRNKTQAVKARRAMIEGLSSGRIAAPSTTTVADFAAEWLATREGRVKPRTYEADQRNVALIDKHFGTTRLQDLTARRIEAFLAACRNGSVTDKKLAEWTCVQAFGTLRKVCDTAVANDLLIVNPCTKVARHARPRQVAKSKPRILSAEQMDALVVAAGKRTPSYAALIAFLAYTGSRAREALGLRWGDVDSTGRLVAIAHQIDKAGTAVVELKTASAERTNAIVPKLERFLGREARMQARWSSDSDFVFSARRGKPVEYRNLRRALEVSAEEADLGHVRPHDLRHSFTSNLLQSVDLATASRYVGHKNVQVTAKVYAHAIGSDAEQAARVAEAMKVAGLGH